MARIGNPHRGSKRAKTVEAKGGKGYQPHLNSNKNNGRPERHTKLHGRHGTKRFTWISSWYRAGAQQIKEFFLEGLTEGSGQQRPLTEGRGGGQSRMAKCSTSLPWPP